LLEPSSGAAPTNNDDRDGNNDDKARDDEKRDIDRRAAGAYAGALGRLVAGQQREHRSRIRGAISPSDQVAVGC
jgi:hypothetical protein